MPRLSFVEYGDVLYTSLVLKVRSIFNSSEIRESRYVAEERIHSHRSSGGHRHYRYRFGDNSRVRR